MDWTSTQLCSDLVYGLVYPQIFDSHKRRSDEAQAATLERAKERAQTWLTVLNDSILGPGNNYLCGDRLTIADYHAVSYVALAEVIGSDLAAYPNVRAWLGRMKALKSWPKVWSVIDGFAETLKSKPMVASDRRHRDFRSHAMIRKLHHNAYRCRDSEETRRFYEDFLGLPLVQAFEIGRTKTGRETHALHTFYRLDDGSHLAFFEARTCRSSSRPQHDFDLHIALEVGAEALPPMMAKAKGAGLECRGPSDHGMIDSIYFRDPNGYVIELCAKRAGHDAQMDPGGQRRARRAAALDGGKATQPA
jgi:catechol 2,3-dioxygenase-like lactoylglutathione lyase family enzyme